MLFSILITTISVQLLGLLWVSRLLAIRSKSLKQIQADLDDARQIKTDFLSIVSHELHTPMMGRSSEDLQCRFQCLAGNR